MMRVHADFGAVAGEVAHVAGISGVDPLAIPGGLGHRLGRCDAGEFEAAFAGQGAHLAGGQISSPTERINSSALLFWTTPGRMM